MTGAQVIKFRNMYESIGPYKIMLDNSRFLYTGIEKSVLVFDDANEMVYCFNSGVTNYNTRDNLEVLSSAYEHIQYFIAQPNKIDTNTVLETLVTDGLIDEAKKQEIYDMFFKRR